MKAMTTNIPTLAIYFPSLENLGGIERVVEAQTLIFAKHGIHVLLVTEQPVGKLRPSLENYCRFACLSRESSRKDQWEKIIREHRPSLVILHGAFMPLHGNGGHPPPSSGQNHPQYPFLLPYPPLPDGG